MLNLTLTDETGAAAAARRGLLEGNGTLPPAIRDDVLLLVSELVTNAVRHAGAGPERPVRVQVLHGPSCVVVAVIDRGPGFTRNPRPSTGSESGGWGLFLVDQIADRWDVEYTASGSRVWFKIEYAARTGGLPAPPQQPRSLSAACT
jgi:anti-sigma regulatory factor (Ser/Thr protein kinase)